MTYFFANQSAESRERYVRYLVEVGGLSRLFSDSEVPYLYYRAHENAFCEAFGAQNLARGDISFDAKKSNIAIGLKTFLYGNGESFQKIAEFNSESKNLREMENVDLARYVADLRNARLIFAKNATGCDEMLYHLAVRGNGKISLAESQMDYINVAKIRIIDDKPNTLIFCDDLNNYSFSKSKSTLLEKFNVRNPVVSFDVNIMSNPFEFLDDKLKQVTGVYKNRSPLFSARASTQIVLPLYSSRTGRVEERSGLNQWNAGGRKRDINEVYIPIPAEIREKVRDFFGESARFDDNKSMKDSEKFEVLLPSGKTLICKIAQQGGKALMSERNADLGKWLLRDVLHLPEGKLVSRELLNLLGIDSVRLTKIDNGKFAMDFAKTDSYNDFLQNNKW